LALGAAILERLTELKAHVIATTHHGMLKAFAHEQEGMENAAMEFDMQTLQPTYRFRAGLPGSSYAFEITRRHGMNSSIIERARDIMGTQSNALEHLLAEVERQSQALGNRLRRSELLEEKYRSLAEEYESKMKLARSEARDLKKHALEDAQRIVNDARASVEQSIREIREEQASREAIHRAHERMEQQKQSAADGLREMEVAQPAPALVDRPLMPGDEVFMVDNPATIGTVLDTASGARIPVAFGSMRMLVETEKLRRHEGVRKPVPAASVHMEAVERNEIDIRGLYGDDAIRKIDLFLYQAWTTGFLRVDIIHGKGTGALRQKVHSYLKDLPFVESFQLGEWNEGGSGVTKVVFKGD
jgi:DNA mismatch repair protein MutS2